MSTRSRDTGLVIALTSTSLQVLLIKKRTAQLHTNLVLFLKYALQATHMVPAVDQVHGVGLGYRLPLVKMDQD